MKRKVAISLILAFIFSGWPVSSVGATDLSWWDEDWSYRVPVIIKIQDTNFTYDNYFMVVPLQTSQLISDGKLSSDLSDLRMVNEFNEEIDIKLLKHPDGNTSIWFGFTGTPPESTTYYLYYGNPEAQSLPDYPFSHWGDNVTGDDFDQETPGEYPSTWINDPGGNTAVVDGM